MSLDLSYSMLDGDVAALSSFSQCSILETPRIDHDKLHGSLHMDFTKWPGLNYLYIGGNKLSGGLPSSFGSINSSFALVYFNQDGFTGGFLTQSGWNPTFGAACCVVFTQAT